jgi:hypothetical protein
MFMVPWYQVRVILILLKYEGVYSNLNLGLNFNDELDFKVYVYGENSLIKKVIF